MVDKLIEEDHCTANTSSNSSDTLSDISILFVVPVQVCILATHRATAHACTQSVCITVGNEGYWCVSQVICSSVQQLS
jgi:hypothetical protein